MTEVTYKIPVTLAVVTQQEKKPIKRTIFCEKFAKTVKATSFRDRRLNRAFALAVHGGASA
jgi:hypothetical protein